MHSNFELFHSKLKNKRFTYYPEVYFQNPSESIVDADGKYDLTRFSQHEINTIKKALAIVESKYPIEYQSLGLVNETYEIVYKPRYVLYEIAIIKYRASKLPLDRFSVACAFANKGADYRLAALGEFEKSIGQVSLNDLDKFSSLNSALICSLFSRLYEQEWEFDNAIFWLRKAMRRGGLNNSCLAERISAIQSKKVDVAEHNKHKRNRKVSVENEEFERKVHTAAIKFLQE